MKITLPALRRHRDGSGRRPRRAARLSAALAVLAVPPLLGATLASPASASGGFTTHVSPENTFFLVLDVSGGSTYPGAPVIDWYANGGANQNWLFLSMGSSVYNIINVNSNMCLTSDGVAGDQVYQDPCNGSLLQLWSTKLTPGIGFTSYPILSLFSGLYLDVSGGSPSAGASIDTWYDNGQNNQRFGGL